jgi:hypothetical protein
MDDSRKRKSAGQSSGAADKKRKVHFLWACHRSWGFGRRFRTHHTQFIVMLNVNNDLQGPKQWLVPRRGESKVASGGTIEPGDAGIWATCGMGKEGKCAAELKDIFNEVPRKG